MQFNSKPEMFEEKLKSGKGFPSEVQNSFYNNHQGYKDT